MRTRAFISAALAVMFVVPALAQKPRYEGIQNRNYYLGGNNIAGMRGDNVNISTARLGGSYTFGENRKGFEAPETWTVSADASTIKHLKKFSMFGKFNFSHTTGYRMFTSMMIEPGRYPIDILEFTAGTKNRQNYGFTGGVSVDLSERWRFGARVDFSATNYAKLKDLRYTDFGLDFNFRPGFQWVGDKIKAGAALSLVRNKESIKAEQIGESSDPYYAFLNKGSWYGVRQPWTGVGVHLDEPGVDGFPVDEIGGGLSAQLEWKGLYAEASYVRTAGKVGEGDAIFFRFPVDKYNLTLAWRLKAGDGSIHTARMDYGFKNTVLDESVIDRVTENGVTTRHTYAWNTIQRKHNQNLMLSWTGVKAGKYSFRVHALYVSEDLCATIKYPRIDTHLLEIFNMNASLTWFFGRHWSLDSGLWAGMGFYMDEMKLSASSDVSSPDDYALYRSPRDYTNWELQVTRPYVGAKIAPRYTFKNNIYLSAEIGTEYKVLPVEAAKRFRTTSAIVLGYVF